ncbi:unnamed protein product [marine sediment metagenome]|uniref:Uncharacterized protein n=1 Tax=marine sediment metagenome TaxID=412755 RepID=X1QUP7_9ZZZZ
MSMELDQETKAQQPASQQSLGIALNLAEQARIKVKTDPCPLGGGFAAFSDDNLSGFAYDLKSPYFVAVLWQTGDKFLPDPEDGRGLKNCQACILKYESHHAKWSVEAYNAEIGNKSFAKLVRKYIEG